MEVWWFRNHGVVVVLLWLELAVLWRGGFREVGAQSSPTDQGFGRYPYAPFTPSMAVIVILLVGAVVFMVFFAIYIRRCSGGAGAAGSGGSIRHALSFRSRRTAAARGLDRDVLETFPTFSYSEVKDHKIGKGALECAVCLNEFGDDETLRLLPKCDHVFHPECIDAWLESHVTCPVCRANLEPSPEDDAGKDSCAAENTDLESSRTDRITIQLTENQPQQPPASMIRNASFESPARSWSVRQPRLFGFGKFRSHSTGHFLIQPGENHDRYTLRLPAEVRKEVMVRASLNRVRSCAAVLPRECSSRRGYRTAGGGEGSSRTGRFYQRLDRSDRGTNSNRWNFLTRGFSMRSTRVVAETAGGGGGGGSSRAPVRMPSLRCLEPNSPEQTGLFKAGPSDNPA
ncbi:E3 ubiquitin-protein ligase ATL31-like [Andrographis paniculata]|uniref:E3 ubiquitin-protein ligase ATL31-like n=1 Tax=Andrographis paniculata TaxID=175694 RepID=UPI0021E7C59A|nr:E3 ubiquitin-protein ligase ATL31-like [Andrographis paniculata]